VCVCVCRTGISQRNGSGISQRICSCPSVLWTVMLAYFACVCCLGFVQLRFVAELTSVLHFHLGLKYINKIFILHAICIQVSSHKGTPTSHDYNISGNCYRLLLTAWLRNMLLMTIPFFLRC
jgi:hypothetical protein